MLLEILFKKFMLLLPPTCLLCGYPSQQTHNICAPCQQNLPILSHHCQQCAQILTHDTLCHSCQKNTPPFDRTYALSVYQAPMIRIIKALKFRHNLSYAALLGALLTEKIRSTWYHQQSLPDLIIPVPLHRHRLKERGFNQALEIARPISKALHIPLDTHGVQRIKATAAQSSLSAIDRQHNMINAFATHRQYQGLSIAVLDDVMTTGHTLSALCHVLKKAGASRLDIWCCARAIENPSPFFIAQPPKTR